MFANSMIAASAALLAMAAAVPMADQHHHHHPAHKREYVWVSHTEVVIETVAVTKTVWVDAGEETPAVYGHHGKHSQSTSAATVAAFTPSASPESSPESTPQTYAAPSSTSTSVYVAPVPTTPSSTYVAPVSTTTSSTPTSTYVAPVSTTPTSTYVAPTTTSAAASAYTSASSSSGSGLSSGMAASGSSFTGDLTWYDVGLGACGWTNTADEAIVAISEAIFDSYSTGNPNTNPLCGKYLTITGKDGSAYKAKIVDRCPGCAESDLDLSQDFFNKVTENGDGRVSGMEWTMD